MYSTCVSSKPCEFIVKGLMSTVSSIQKIFDRYRSLLESFPIVEIVNNVYFDIVVQSSDAD